MFFSFKYIGNKYGSLSHLETYLPISVHIEERVTWMLKITFQNTSVGLRLQLEGRLAGPWVEELKHSWDAAVSSPERGTLLVDLTEVTFIDAAGEKLLAQMFEQGAEFRATGCMTRCIIEEIKRRVKAPSR